MTRARPGIALALVGLLASGATALPSLAGEAAPAAPATTATAIFAGGCFWCMEPPFDAVPGVIATISGYTGGPEANPTYEQVSSGRTGHYEAIAVTYDPQRVSYQQLLDVFWRNIDPLDDNGQFCDQGPQYRSAIFVASDEQRRLAEASKSAIEATGRFDRPIVTSVLPVSAFTPAEDYHQDFYKKNPVRYYSYRSGCGRDRRLQRLWGADASPSNPSK
jgi:peptide-methionine (S)-S-oxide reductase